jgi:hypothetical protein
MLCVATLFYVEEMINAKLWSALVTLSAACAAMFASSCGDPTLACTVDSDCELQDECTTGACISGTCQYTPVETPPCACTVDADCDDGDDCTEDVCAENGSCTNPPSGACCILDSDCDDGLECTVDTCSEADGCVFDATACCNSDGRCDSKEDCNCADCTSDPGCVTLCNEDGACDPAENCDCADCAALETCGAGCIAFTIENAASSNFLDATPSNLGGPMPDYFQGFGLTTPGTYSPLSPPQNIATDCMGPTPCIQVNVDGATFYRATSGTLDLTAVAPIEAVFTDVVFHPSTVDAQNNVTVDLDGECLYLKQATIPTP